MSQIFPHLVAIPAQDFSQEGRARVLTCNVPFRLVQALTPAGASMFLTPDTDPRILCAGGVEALAFCKPLEASRGRFRVSDHAVGALLVVTNAVQQPVFTVAVDGASAPAPTPAPAGDQLDPPASQEIISQVNKQDFGRFLVFFKSGGLVAVQAPAGYGGDYPQALGSVYQLPAGWAKG
jgi:hypothetical protein